MDAGKEGGVRLLTSGEIAMARKIFRNSISYNKIWIHHGSYLPFGLQNKNTSMAPNGEIYFRDYYTEDFSVTVPGNQHLFIHEMAHVWQREKGMNVIMRGLLSWAADYRYHLNGRELSAYSMEQQAEIIADYFILTEHGYSVLKLIKTYSDAHFTDNHPESTLISKYNKTLNSFPCG